MSNRTYAELSRLHTLEDRYEYLRLHGRVGEQTFGHERGLNQEFYSSYRWKQVRKYVIDRDMGCDLGIEGFDITSKLQIHHINPLTPADLRYNRSCLTDIDNLITTSHRTHMAIHYGDERHLPRPFVERRPGDT